MPERAQLAARPITDDDATIARHVEQASVGARMMSMVHWQWTRSFDRRDDRAE